MIANKADNPQGLHTKYRIFKDDMTNLPDGEYFVLRLDTAGDPAHVSACREAILVYADRIEPHLPLLASDIRTKYAK